jgi:lipooligosaccharide transport system permease protein
MTTPRPMRFFESRARVYRFTWRGSAISAFLNPVLYLAAMGLGLGTLIDDGSGSAVIGSLTYLEYLAPGLLVAAAMQTGAGEAMWPVMAGIKWRRSYDAVLATPVRVLDLVTGYLAWLSARLLMSTFAFVVVMALFGAVDFGRGLLAIGPAVLMGTAMAAPIMAYTSSLQDEQGLSGLFRFVIIPMFLFSGTFFPISQLPDWLEPVASITPLWHGVELARAASLGLETSWSPLAHIGFLLAVGAVGMTVAVRILGKRMLS